MIFPEWLEDLLQVTKQLLPALILIGVVGVLWWRRRVIHTS
jgi:hypothetical protein